MLTRINKMLGIKYPIFQGGMANIADSNLAAAVSNAGGLGIIAAGGYNGERVREEIKKAKSMTDKVFGVNIMLLSPYADEIAKVVYEEDVKVVTTGAGSPGKYMDMWKKKGIHVIPVVASVALARRMEAFGADAVVAEGCEAGGHIGELTTMTLVPQVVDAVKIPVVAAGGIGDGRGMLAAFMLGAEGIQVGTRFLSAKECIIHENYKKMVLDARDIDTEVTGRSTGHPVRVLKNVLARRILELEKKCAPQEEIDNICKGSLTKAVVYGDLREGSFMAGQIAGLIKKEQTCAEIIEDIVRDAKGRLEDFKWER